MKRIVVCLDGTWNQVRNPATVTNVVRIAEAVRPCASDNTAQIVYYNSGVGTGDLIDRFLGGLFGRGVKSSVKRAYAFLSLNYEVGDEIYLFGFSRGAYTARALGGLWDTVASYGVPAGFGLGALARYVTSWQRGFHDTHISDKVAVGLQALAIDERRRPFSPTFWTIPNGQLLPASTTVQQVWFCGAHANVGGGYDDQHLAHQALIWMIARVMARTGLAFDIDYVRRTTTPSALGLLNRSERFWPVSRIWPFLRPVVPTSAAWDHVAHWNSWPIDELPLNEQIHWSVVERYGKVAPVEGEGEQLYTPKNLGQGIPLTRVAGRTPEETLLMRV